MAVGTEVNWQDATRKTDLTLSGVTDAITGLAAVPLLGIILGTQNDALANSPTIWTPYGTTLELAAMNSTRTIIDAWMTARPGKPLVVFGPSWPSNGPQLASYHTRDGMAKACWMHASDNVWFIDRMSPTPETRSGGDTYFTTTGNMTNASAVVTNIPSTANVGYGSLVEGTGIANGSYVLSVDSSTQITLSRPATATATGVTLAVQPTESAYYHFDGAHPNQRGHDRDAYWCARELRRLILTEFA